MSTAQPIIVHQYGYACKHGRRTAPGARTEAERGTATLAGLGFGIRAKAPARPGVSGAGAGGMGVSAAAPSPSESGLCSSSSQKASKTSRVSALRQLRNPAAHWTGESGAVTIWMVIRSHRSLHCLPPSEKAPTVRLCCSAAGAWP